MATYAIGDIQGCFESLQGLLRTLGFDPASDRLWLVGDLVNRGPRSLDVLRFVYEHRASTSVVLGNHDVHLLARAEGVRSAKRADTLDALIQAPDGPALIGWLGQQPLWVESDTHVMVHAGLLPTWTLATARGLAEQLRAHYTAKGWSALLLKPERWRWQEGRASDEQFPLALAAFTRLRACDAAGAMETKYKGPLAQLPPDLVPWFAHPQRAARSKTIVCGHWAALGLHREHGVIALDTGCVWGGALTAVRLEDGATFSQPAIDNG